MDILLILLVAVGFQVSFGQELAVECFTGTDSCSGSSGFNVSSSTTCCQSQSNIDISYSIRDQCITCPAVAFEFKPVATVTEGSINNIEVCLVSIEGADVVNSTISIVISTVQESAFGFNDYIPLTDVELVFLPGDVEQCVNMSLVDDDSFEEEELFRVVGMSNENGVVIGDLIINIADNDDILIGITDILPVNVSEGDPFVTAVVEIISGKLEIPVTILVSTEDISAIGGEDYTTVSIVSLVLSGQVSSVRVDIELREDGLLEGLEMFRVGLQLMNQGLSGITFDSQTRDISITDNDRATIGFLAQSLNIAEASPAIDACFIVKSGDIAKDVIMDIIFTGEALEGVDFNNISKQYLINGDTSSGCITFGPIDDEVLENDETTTITLRTDDSNVDIDIAQLVITIIDNEELEIRFSNILKEYSEDQVSDTVCVEIIPPSGGLEQSVIVSVELTSDPELNVLFESQNVTFSNNDDVIKCLPVMVIDDLLVEGNRTIVFSLSSIDDDVTISTPVQSFVLRDNDISMPVQVCTVSDELKLETFHMEGLSSGLVYDFSEGCEHVLLSSCDPTINFEVRIDFLHNTFSTQSILVSYNGQQVMYKNDIITELSANISEYEIVRSSSDLSIRVPNVGVNLVFNTTFITIYYTPSSIRSLNGLCGNGNGEILLANCNDVFNTSEISTDRIDEFIEGYRVKQTELALGPQRVECGISGNSTVIGDPLFTTPILPDVSDIAVGEQLSLCYEIHGEPNAYFNLITDECITVNAHYVEPSLADYLNVMDLVTVVAIDNQNNCHRIQMDVNGCKVTFDGIEVTRDRNLSEISRNDSYHVSPFVSNGVEIRLYNNRARISVPNCADLSVSMWIACQNQLVTDPYTDVPLGYVPMLKVVVNGGINIPEQSHGLIGQFWNIPVNITKYIGQLNSDIKDPSDYFLVSFNHHSLLKSRQFVGIAHGLTWSRENGVCLFVGNKQGGPISEVENPNDPVIEGDYKDYIVDSRFDTDFKYSVFKTEMCDFN